MRSSALPPLGLLERNQTIKSSGEWEAYGVQTNPL
jgi:hypothetical protein